MQSIPRLSRGTALVHACALPLAFATITPALETASIAREPTPSHAAPLPADTEAADLREQIMAASSATAVLDAWCAEHGMASAGSVRVDKIENRVIAPDEGLKQRLRLTAGETVQLRHVRLRCGSHILSSARLWYVPSRLPGAIETMLQHTDTPFGRAVVPLNLERRSLGTTSLRPLSRRQHAVPTDLFSQHAALGHPGEPPLAYVVETYHSGALDFLAAPVPVTGR